MHMVVEIIPLLLHMSLLLFFSGLVAFLIPVDLAMAIIATIILAIVAIVYCTITLLPLRYLDCPYQTPLSGIFWNFVAYFLTFCDKPNFKPNVPQPADTLPCNTSTIQPLPKENDVKLSPKAHDETMMEAMCYKAMEVSEDRANRDYKALVWTMKSLTDDRELEPFIEAIPDLLWSPTSRRCHTYDHHIRGLVQHPDVCLLDRILGFYRSCHTGAFSPSMSQHRIIASHQAFWAITSLSDSNQSSGIGNAPPLDFSHIYHNVYRTSLESHPVSLYSVPAATMILWSMFYTIRNDLLKAQYYLENSEGRSEDISELEDISHYLWKVHSQFHALGLPGFMTEHASLPSRIL
ncbi:hypothetical protein C8R45DRAFT_1164950 [Mycena sanguinolenta]|nr:hypothetical protein C8R45DRAFT_1164950 [Mycena sanguinolenta]